MRLRVEDIKETPQEIEYVEEVASLNALLASKVPSEYRFTEGLVVHITYSRSGLDIFFCGSVAGKAVGTCARCLEEYPFVQHKAFSLVLSPRKEVRGERELTAEALQESEYEGPEIDLTPLMHEEAILGLPTRPLCRPDCRGLCPVCGENRNLVRCGCEREVFDPRLAVLRSLKIGR